MFGDRRAQLANNFTNIQTKKNVPQTKQKKNNVVLLERLSLCHLKQQKTISDGIALRVGGQNTTINWCASIV